MNSGICSKESAPYLQVFVDFFSLVIFSLCLDLLKRI